MITLDITTRNTVYNPLSAQGQWIQHRFGCRSYPTLDLDLDTIKLALEKYNTIILRSIYGDPLCHSSINAVIDLIEQSKKQCIIFSYLNITDSDLICRLSTIDNITLYAIVDGYKTYGHSILESNSNTVFENIKLLGNKAVIEFFMYGHNLQDYDLVKQDFDCEIKLLPGKRLCDGPSSIIDRNGEWLYDVCPVDNFDIKLYDSNLVKHLDSYKILLTYLRDVEGSNILDAPLIIRTIKNTDVFDIDMPAISVTGHVFKSTEYMSIFSNALCNDWNINTDNISFVNKTIIAKLNSVTDRDAYAIRINTVLLDITNEGLSSFCDRNI